MLLGHLPTLKVDNYLAKGVGKRGIFRGWVERVENLINVTLKYT